jgi:glyoxylase-like metal-dependent hydrolase (beta-lactamase superfamily II)
MRLAKNLYFYPEKGMLDCNTYVIKGNPTVIIDPGSTQFLTPLIQDLHQDGIKVKDIDIITNTHLHCDHCWANEAFKQISGARILSHPQQKKFYNAAVIETANFFGLPPIDFEADGYLDKNKLDTGDIELELIPSPGHSPDSICFYSHTDKTLVCGDVLFDHNTGRVDLPGGNADELRHSIDTLSRLEIDFLLPGHMGIISDAEQVKRNFEFINRSVLSWL